MEAKVRSLIVLGIVIIVLFFIIRLSIKNNKKRRSLYIPPVKQEKKEDVEQEKKEENLFITKGSKFLYIPVSRLVIMSIITLGLYEAYWIYKNWKYIKERDRLKIEPFWRAIFGLFFCHSLFNSIKNDSEVNTIRKAEFSASGLATGWVILTILSNLLIRYGSEENTTLYILGLIIFFFSFLFFLPVQNYINTVNGSIEPRPRYNGWSTGHFVCLIIGIITWILTIYGIFYSIENS